jgi:SAM-dependent methyltransferase
MSELWLEGQPQRLWRRHSDRVNSALVDRWLPPVGSVLKTDLFDEAVGEGLYPTLAARARTVVGIDSSERVVEAAGRRYPALDARCADVRRLPFADGELDGVVSNSTLDHFESADEIAVALGELARILRPGGVLLVTLDNPLNPIVAATKLLPRTHLNRLWLRVAPTTSKAGIVPYEVGATVGPARLHRLLTDTGFDVLERRAIVHFPRLAAVLAGGVIERRDSKPLEERFLRLLWHAERFGSRPTRFFTGHFLAVRARRR